MKAVLRRLWDWIVPRRDVQQVDASAIKVGKHVIVSKGRLSVDSEKVSTVVDSQRDVIANKERRLTDEVVNQHVEASADRQINKGYDESGDSGQSYQEIQIGLDIGSSTSKVCVYHNASGKRVFVDFGSYAQPGHPNLIDTSLIVEASGGIRIPQHHELATHTQLKLTYFQLGHHSSDATNISPDQSETLLREYVKALLSYCVSWLRSNYKHLVGDSNLLITLNVGVPSSVWVAEPIDAETGNDKSPRVDQFHLLVSQAGQQLTEEYPGLELIETNILPEVVAELIPILNRRRSDGMHMIMDVGRGTVDLLGFIYGRDLLRGEHDRRYTLLECKVKWYGTAFLEDGEQNERTKTKQITSFVTEVTELSRQANSHASEWRDGVPIILLGGGRDLQPYQKAIQAASFEIQRHMSPSQAKSFSYLRIVRPTVDDVDVSRCVGMDLQDVHRLLVAYGLTYPIDDVGVVCDVVGRPVLKATEHSFELNPDLY